MPGTLYVVATPIGNLEDITLRALRVLREADLIAAEDTRRTAKLLAEFSIASPTLSFHEHNTRTRIPQLLTRLKAGAAVALVTDAGTPGISDPGERLVSRVVGAGYAVSVVPGPSAPVAALVASGLPTERWCMEGFLPRKGSARADRRAELAVEERTMVLFESPHRLAATLADLATALDLVSSHIAIARAGDDHVEAIEAFRAKRDGEYVGY